jgi:hypothetical protein
VKNYFRFGFDGGNCLKTGARQMKCGMEINHKDIYTLCTEYYL